MSPVLERVLNITHRTHYIYEEPVSSSRHKSFLTPRSTLWQSVSHSAVTIEPAPGESSALVDYYGNQVTLFSVSAPHEYLRVEARSEVTLLGASNPVAEGQTWEGVRRIVRDAAIPEDLQALEFCFRSPHVPLGDELFEYARECFGGRTFLDDVSELMHRIHREFEYDPTITTVSTPVSDVFRQKRGVCQDFAHFMIACLRSAGLAARYVSGYLVPSGDVVGAQASHAWVSVFAPGRGWVDFDPTNNVLPSSGHITLAWGRDFSDVSPFSGVTVGGGAHEVTVEVEVVDGR